MTSNQRYHYIPTRQIIEGLETYGHMAQMALAPVMQGRYAIESPHTFTPLCKVGGMELAIARLKELESALSEARESEAGLLYDLERSDTLLNYKQVTRCLANRLHDLESDRLDLKYRGVEL